MTRVLSWVMLTAGRAHVKRGIWEVVLDRLESECSTFLELLTITEKPHLFHHKCFLVAEVDGNPVAALSGHDPQVWGYPALVKAMPEVFRKLHWPQPDQAWHDRSDRVLCCIPDDADGAWVVESVATIPEFRRRGIVDALLSAILEKGRREGFSLAQISIYIGNIPAQKAYEKYGFKIVSEKRHPDFEAEIGSPGMACLLRDL